MLMSVVEVNGRI